MSAINNRKEAEIHFHTYYCDRKWLEENIGHDFDPYIFKDLTVLGPGDPDYGYEFDEDLQHFPIYLLSVLLRQILKYSWPDMFMPTILEMRKRNEEVLIFWQDKCGFDIDQEVDFYLYPNLLDMKNLDEALDWIGAWPDGCKEDDAKLLAAVVGRNYKEIERLLKGEVNPKIYFNYGCSAEELACDRCSMVGGFEKVYNDYWHYLNDADFTPSRKISPQICSVLNLAIDNKIDDMIANYMIENNLYDK